MQRHLLVFPLLLAACAQPSPPPQAPVIVDLSSPPRLAPPPMSSPQPSPPPPPSAGPLPPSGLYAVSQRVISDTCGAPRTMPPQVTVLSRDTSFKTLQGTIHTSRGGSIPVLTFGRNGRTTERIEANWRGSSASGMSHPKVCPGIQQTWKTALRDVTPTGFTMHLEYERADGWDCPTPRPAPLCRTEVALTYTLASAACDGRCNGSVPGLKDKDVPDGPVEISCSCPQQ